MINYKLHQEKKKNGWLVVGVLVFLVGLGVPSPPPPPPDIQGTATGRRASWTDKKTKKNKILNSQSPGALHIYPIPGAE